MTMQLRAVGYVRCEVGKLADSLIITVTKPIYEQGKEKRLGVRRFTVAHICITRTSPGTGMCNKRSAIRNALPQCKGWTYVRLGIEHFRPHDARSITVHRHRLLSYIPFRSLSV